MINLSKTELKILNKLSNKEYKYFLFDYHYYERLRNLNLIYEKFYDNDNGTLSPKYKLTIEGEALKYSRHSEICQYVIDKILLPLIMFFLGIFVSHFQEIKDFIFQVFNKN